MKYKKIHNKKLQRCLDMYLEYSNFTFEEFDEPSGLWRFRYKITYMGEYVKDFITQEQIKDYLKSQGFYYGI